MKLILFISIVLFSSPALCQQGEDVYLYFDPKNKETCEVLKDGGGFQSIPKYNTIRQKSGEIDFYICEAMFVLSKDRVADTCTTKEVKAFKFHKITELQKLVDSINPFYPFKVFKNVYLVEPLDDSNFLRYDVKWQYYIE